MANKSKTPKPTIEPEIETPELETKTTTIPPILKPAPTSHLSRFKSKRTTSVGGVPKLVTELPILRVGEVNDFMRTYPDDTSEYWSDILCFCRVPIKDTKGSILHLIDEDIADANLQPKDILRFRLILASKPDGEFFLCIMPVENLENSFNASAIEVINLAKDGWFKPVSRKKEGSDTYLALPAVDDDAYSDPKWPTSMSMDTLIDYQFRGPLQIVSQDNPGLARLVGRKAKLT